MGEYKGGRCTELWFFPAGQPGLARDSYITNSNAVNNFDRTDNPFPATCISLRYHRCFHFAHLACRTRSLPFIGQTVPDK